jgi:hypothetical protein
MWINMDYEFSRICKEAVEFCIEVVYNPSVCLNDLR